MSTQVKKCKVQFEIFANPCHETLYVIGDCAELGAWDVTKGLKLTYNEETKSYSGSKMIAIDCNVSYKVCASKSWENVELTDYYTEVANHNFTATKGHKEVLTINNFMNK